MRHLWCLENKLSLSSWDIKISTLCLRVLWSWCIVHISCDKQVMVKWQQDACMTLLFYAGYQWELLWGSLEYDLEIFAVNYLKH